MSKALIKQFIEAKISNSGLFETGIKGVHLFRITQPMQCAPAVYEPSVVAIVGGSKEAVFDGNRHVFDASRYLCCSIPMPLESGAPKACPDNPFVGVYISSHLSQPVTIEAMAHQVGMSRAVFHRKFKQATSMSPIQFVKSMRLNKAATKIAGGANVNLAAMDVGYVSTSQFSREFKRMYGLSPKQWTRLNQPI